MDFLTFLVFTIIHLNIVFTAENIFEKNENFVYQTYKFCCKPKLIKIELELKNI